MGKRLSSRILNESFIIDSNGLDDVCGEILVAYSLTDNRDDSIFCETLCIHYNERVKNKSKEKIVVYKKNGKNGVVERIKGINGHLGNSKVPNNVINKIYENVNGDIRKLLPNV